MRLNTISPAAGSKSSAKRVGRGIGSGLGKTSGKGHKGQKARSGGYHKVGFEGGQMPIQRRLPKFGFTAPTNKHFAEVRLSEIANLNVSEVDLSVLKEAGVVRKDTTGAKIILSGEITNAVTVKGISCTKGVKAAIEKVGGKVE